MTRIACIQLSIGADEAENLKKCLALIDDAGLQKPDLIVLPEMSNWSAGQVRSRSDALAHGAEVPGPFIDAIAERASRHACFVAIGMIEKLGEESFITTVIVAPDKTIALKYQKQIPFGAQRIWATPGRLGNPTVQLPFGRVGVYICADGLIPEPSRMLALQGAHLLLNTLHSGGTDETFLHVPARAVENRVWVASANKVGPREFGGIGTYCGGSQIVSPTGEVVARADNKSDCVVWADVDLSTAADKILGEENIHAIRRPECYGAIVSPPARSTRTAGPASLGVAALQTRGTGEAAVLSAVAAWRGASAAGAKLMVLPELFPYERAAIAANPAGAAAEGCAILRALCAVAKETATWGVVNLIESDDARYFSTGFLIDDIGTVAGKYRQVHVSAKFRGWMSAGSEFEVFETAVGRIGMLCGEDILIPEAFRALAYLGAEVIAVPMRWRADYEIDLIAPERVAENRVNIVFARGNDSIVSRGSAIVGVVAYPSEPHWKVRSPDVIEAKPGAEFLVHGVNLKATEDKAVGAQGCDLMASAVSSEYALLVKKSC